MIPESLFFIVSKYFEVESVHYSGERLSFFGRPIGDPDESFDNIYREIRKFDFIPAFFKKDGHIELRIVKFSPVKAGNHNVNLILLFLTVITTVLAGVMLSGKSPLIIKNWIYGIPYSIAIMTILGAHELGHYFACKKYGVRATLPYFIPVPTFVGTFGAIIRIKSPIPNRRSLMVIGASGPFIGLFFAILFTIIGLKLSKVVPRTGAGLSLGSSLLFSFLSKMVYPDVPAGMTIALNPLAFAGWLGMFVTAMNLLPVGQLDGGHIAYSLFGEKQRYFSLPVIALLIYFGIKYWVGWFLWALLLAFLAGVRHPPTLNDLSKLKPAHRIMGIAGFIVLIVTFIPSPFPGVKLG